MKNEIKVLLVEPGKYPRMTAIRNELDALQETVGGFIEAIYPFDDEVAIVCNEEGKLDGSALNRALRDDNGEIYDIIAGTFFVCGLGEEDFDSLPESLVSKYESLFHNPEGFVSFGGHIVSVPVDPM